MDRLIMSSIILTLESDIISQLLTNNQRNIEKTSFLVFSPIYPLFPFLLFWAEFCHIFTDFCHLHRFAWGLRIFIEIFAILSIILPFWTDFCHFVLVWGYFLEILSRIMPFCMGPKDIYRDFCNFEQNSAIFSRFLPFCMGLRIFLLIFGHF